MNTCTFLIHLKGRGGGAFEQNHACKHPLGPQIVIFVFIIFWKKLITYKRYFFYARFPNNWKYFWSNRKSVLKSVLLLFICLQHFPPKIPTWRNDEMNVKNDWDLEYDSIFCACCGGMAEVQEYPCPGGLAWSMCRLDHGGKSGFLTLWN